MFNMPKKAFWRCFHLQFLKFARANANKGICSSRKCSTCRKNGFLHRFHDQFLKTASETQIKANAVFANAQHAEKARFCSDFTMKFSKTALKTHIKAFAVIANVQHAEKRVFALFSSSTFEIFSRNANIGINSIRTYSTCRKTRFCSDFIMNF